MKCLVDEQTEFERDALGNTQPTQVVANQWRHVVILAATKDDTSGTDIRAHYRRSNSKNYYRTLRISLSFSWRRYHV